MLSLIANFSAILKQSYFVSLIFVGYWDWLEPLLFYWYELVYYVTFSHIIEKLDSSTPTFLLKCWRFALRSARPRARFSAHLVLRRFHQPPGEFSSYNLVWLFSFLFNQPIISISSLSCFLTVGTTITVANILKFPVFDHFRSKLDSQFLQLTDIESHHWVGKG